jgi:hypothetical protein
MLVPASECTPGATVAKATEVEANAEDMLATCLLVQQAQGEIQQLAGEADGVACNEGVLVGIAGNHRHHHRVEVHRSRQGGEGGVDALRVSADKVAVDVDLVGTAGDDIHVQVDGAAAA